MIPGLITVILIQIVIALGAVDRHGDRIALYVIGLALIVRVWAWPNDQRKRYWYERKHGPRPPRGYIGSARETVQQIRAKLQAELQAERDEVFERLRVHRIQWADAI